MVDNHSTKAGTRNKNSLFFSKQELTQFVFRIFSILFCDITPERNLIIVQNKVVDTKYLL